MGDDRTYLFIHVMKTGGTTFSEHVAANFAPHEVFPPEADPDRAQRYMMLEHWQALSPEERDGIRVFMGHVPYFVTDWVRPDVTLTILRDPVARTLSFLRQTQRMNPGFEDTPLEEIYEHPLVFHGRVRDYQAKMFSMRADDGVTCEFDALEVDADRLRLARENLARVDVIGLTEDYGGFLAQVADRFGWQIDEVPDRMVTDSYPPIDDAFRARILADNAADQELYEHARELVASRR